MPVPIFRRIFTDSRSTEGWDGLFAMSGELNG